MEKIVVISESSLDKTLKNVLESNNNYEFTLQTPDTVEKLNETNYSLIVLDILQDKLDIFLNEYNLPVPVLICCNDGFDIKELKCKEYDLIYKPLKEVELKIRLSNLVKLKNYKTEIDRITVCDELTGLHNRKYLIDRLDEELSRSKRYQTPISCILIDIDYFKVINDMYGYTEGDKVLQKIAGLLNEHVRKEDILTRYGDEEYLIALPNTTDRNAYVLAERIRKSIKSYRFFDEEEPMNVTISAGISTYPFPHMEPDVNTLVRYSEHALYNAKKQGKNKVVLFSQINFDF